MTTHITKTWFDGEKVVTQDIPEADFYRPSMSKETEALKLALEALEKAKRQCHHHKIAPHLIYDEAIAAIKEALAQPPLPVQEPYCYVDPVHLAALNTDQSAEVVLHKNPSGYAARGLYTAPQQRTWVGLTDDEVREICVNEWGGYEQCRAIEAKLKEKNT